MGGGGAAGQRRQPTAAAPAASGRASGRAARRCSVVLWCAAHSIECSPAARQRKGAHKRPPQHIVGPMRPPAAAVPCRPPIGLCSPAAGPARRACDQQAPPSGRASCSAVCAASRTISGSDDGDGSKLARANSSSSPRDSGTWHSKRACEPLPNTRGAQSSSRQAARARRARAAGGGGSAATASQASIGRCE